MPTIRMPQTDEDERQKNIREQYEALGRFVEAFESMVDEVRGLSIDRVWAEVISETGIEFELDSDHRKKLIEIPFYQQNMTAKPLWDTMRAILAEVVSRPENFFHQDQSNFKSLLGYIESEYSSLYNKRNELLHGTWLIGYTSDGDPHSAKFRVRKFKTTADGLSEVSELPQDVTELSKLKSRCDAVRAWMSEIDFCFRRNRPLNKHFKRDGKKWFYRPFSDTDDWSTFPEKRG